MISWKEIRTNNKNKIIIEQQITVAQDSAFTSTDQEEKNSANNKENKLLQFDYQDKLGNSFRFSSTVPTLNQLAGNELSHQFENAENNKIVEEATKLASPIMQDSNKSNMDFKDALILVVKEMSKAIDFEESKKELIQRLTNLEKRFDVESLRLLEIENCRREIKDLRERFMNPSFRNQNENNNKISLENIPTYTKYLLSNETIEYLKTPTFNPWHWESNEMICLLEHMFYELGFVKEFNINPLVLKRWLLCIQLNYRNNPFHNFRHCFCVTQMMYGLIHLCDLQSKMTKVDLITLMTACICHDLDHPGFNNAYQINARTELAIRYNDISPLENHHCSVAFQILNNPSCNIFINVPADVFKEIRNGMIKLILATDMAKHKEIYEKLRDFVPVFNFENQEHLDTLKMILIKCCDISNEVRPSEVSEPWLDCLLEEYFMQSEREKIEGLPVAPFMDKEKVTRSGSQIGFIKFVLIPMFEAVGQIFPQIKDNLIKALHDAYNRYEQLKSTEEEKVHKV